MLKNDYFILKDDYFYNNRIDSTYIGAVRRIDQSVLFIADQELEFLSIHAPDDHGHNCDGAHFGLHAQFAEFNFFRLRIQLFSLDFIQKKHTTW